MRNSVTAIVAVIGLTLSAVSAPVQKDSRAEVLLRSAIDKETVDGDLKAAIEIYRKAIASAGANRAVAAKALVRMGQCYEKLGDTEARKAYERVVREFGDQKDLAETASARLAALGKPAGPTGPTVYMISGASSVWVYGPSPDGRYLLQGNKGKLELRDLSTGQVRQLTKEYGYDPAFSRDGRQIAFGRRVKEALVRCGPSTPTARANACSGVSRKAGLGCWDGPRMESESS